MNIGERIAFLRKKKHLRQKDFSEILNLSQATISLWEKGERNPDINSIKEICHFFNVSADYLLGLSEEPNSSNNPQKEDIATEPLQEKLLQIYASLSESNRYHLIGEAIKLADIQSKAGAQTDKKKETGLTGSSAPKGMAVVKNPNQKASGE